ncbi:rod-binding protein [Pacificimonas sp. WHA3]|uniref:Rod-binding protein n=1 Tax=Pacificimonas pallii TaxID=2827236 RepID=A0ABS6SF41_9SPHN|nr:rod-binding protein [Pacificimonas pallii]MBV7257019.1 rod-binding protein [Pacificimonas pallii]
METTFQPIIPNGQSTDKVRDVASGNDLDSAAAEFEAIFARMMLASMRQANLGDDILGGKGGDMFRGRFDGEIASVMGERGALGIGRALSEFLARGKPEGPKE